MTGFRSKIFMVLVASFFLLLFALAFSYKNIEDNSLVIKYLERDQIKLNYYANKLNYLIKSNQTHILQTALEKEKISFDESRYIFDKIHKNIKKLEVFEEENREKLVGFDEVLTQIKQRLVAYKAVENSLIEALNNKDNEDISDALIGLNSITEKFAKDTTRLIDISNELLYTKILFLKTNNEKSATTILISFLVSILLISITAWKFSLLHSKLKLQLQRAEEAEIQQKDLQRQLLKYNEDLEKEVSKKAQEIRQKIYTNFLSGLPNRNKLLEDSSHINFKMMALLNIDKFQSFNDVYGEEIGNIAIKLTAEFLQEEIAQEQLLLYHMSGDEFAIIVKEGLKITEDAFSTLVTNILQDYQRTEFIHEDKHFNFMMSAGVAFSGKRKMLAYADMALKDAKKRNIQLSIFNDDKELERIHQGDLECHKKLTTALAKNKVVSFFQPIVPIQDATTLPLKYESLVRIIEEDGHIVPPFNFIEVAKANRIYYKITRAVIENTLDVVAKYKLPCSLNLSLADIQNENTMKLLFNTLDLYQYNELLTIELLETEDFKNYQVVYDFCIKVRSYGLRVALDDFGSGYSNFSHILNLPIDYIKIDASLISNIDRNHNNKIMVETIVSLAKKLHVTTIAEFVSSKEILDVVKEVGVDYAQGFYLGKPEPIELHLQEGGGRKLRL
jgi:diguanylate cyclase (GGDEF)-like protein